MTQSDRELHADAQHKIWAYLMTHIVFPESYDPEKSLKISSESVNFLKGFESRYDELSFEHRAIIRINVMAFLREITNNYDQHESEIFRIQHGIWVHWLNYMFTCGEFDNSGNWTLPAEKVSRWTRQVNTDYQDLTDGEQESDRHQADKILAVLN